MEMVERVGNRGRVEMFPARRRGGDFSKYPVGLPRFVAVSFSKPQ